MGYEIDTTSGGTGYIPLPAQLAVSGSALVVPDATKEFVEDDLVGLGVAVDEFRSRLAFDERSLRRGVRAEGRQPE